MDTETPEQLIAKWWDAAIHAKGDDEAATYSRCADELRIALLAVEPPADASVEGRTTAEAINETDVQPPICAQHNVPCDREWFCPECMDEQSAEAINGELLAALKAIMDMEEIDGHGIRLTFGWGSPLAKQARAAIAHAEAHEGEQDMSEAAG